MIAAILLAAGHARRFGAPKLLQDLDGKPVVRWSADGLSRAPIGELLVVVPPVHEPIARALQGVGARFVVNPDPAEGMASSIARGVEALGAGVDAVVIALADEPTLRGDVLEGVVARYAQGGAAIVAPRYRGVPGHPVLFDRTIFSELGTLSGDVGARSIVERDPGRVAILDIDGTSPIDVDTPADLQRLRSTERWTR